MQAARFLARLTLLANSSGLGARPIEARDSMVRGTCAGAAAGVGGRLEQTQCAEMLTDRFRGGRRRRSAGPRKQVIETSVAETDNDLSQTATEALTLMADRPPTWPWRACSGGTMTFSDGRSPMVDKAADHPSVGPPRQARCAGNGTVNRSRPTESARLCLLMAKVRRSSPGG